MKLYRRLDGLNQDTNEWVKHVNNIVGKCNNTEHTTIQIKPIEAVKPSNHLWVVWHLPKCSQKRSESMKK